MTGHRQQRGVTLIELLIAVAMGALIVAGMSAVMVGLTESQAAIQERNRLTENGRFAMERMVRMSSESRRLLLPIADNPKTDWPENIREETVPASPPVGSSILATAVLAVTLPAFIDLDADGFPDADDDRDGSIDEDLPNDIHHDFQPGISLIDDDGDGTVDDGTGWAEDDEDGSENEDPVDGIDNDGDGSVDEDPASDNNADNCPGTCGVDDDSDGTVDDGANDDDDEDGGSFDDPYDPVVFYLVGDTLVERMPVPWNEDGISAPDGPVDGRDFVESAIAENVTRFRVERLPANGDTEIVDITLDITGPETGETVNLHTRVRIGGAL